MGVFDDFDVIAVGDEVGAGVEEVDPVVFLKALFMKHMDGGLCFYMDFTDGRLGFFREERDVDGVPGHEVFNETFVAEGFHFVNGGKFAFEEEFSDGVPERGLLIFIPKAS